MYVLIIEVFIIIDLICVIGNDIDQSFTDVFVEDGIGDRQRHRTHEEDDEHHGSREPEDDFLLNGQISYHRSVPFQKAKTAQD